MTRSGKTFHLLMASIQSSCRGYSHGKVLVVRYGLFDLAVVAIDCPYLRFADMGKKRSMDMSR